MNLLNPHPSAKAKAEFLKAHWYSVESAYIDGIPYLLDRAKHLASGMGNAAAAADLAKRESLSHAEYAALAFATAGQIEAAQALLQGLFDDLHALQASGTEGRP